VRRHLSFLALACLVGLAAAALALATPRADTIYKGKTSQKRPVKLRTTEDAAALTGFSIRRELDCGDEGSVAGTFRQTKGVIPIGDDGRFRSGSKVRSLNGGEIKRGRYELGGRFGEAGLGARGTYRERVVLRSGVRCGTGTIKFRVRTRR
jgi:hypothetical protein